jgi:hypothetical protein
MITITHINKHDEDKVAKMIADFLHKDYRYYFQVRTRFDCQPERIPLMITSKDYENLG